MTSSALTPATPRWWHQTWLIVLAGGLIMGLALGVRHVQGMFMLPIIMERGWTRESFGFAMAVQNLTWGLMQPFTGMIADRFGASKVMIAGIALYALGVLLMTQAADTHTFVLSAGVCIGIAQSGTTFGVVYAALSRMVAPERRSWALGVAGAIGGIGQFLLVPATQALLATVGWHQTLVTLAIVAVLLLPLGLPFNDRVPSGIPTRTPTGPTTDAAAHVRLLPALREAFGHSGFWLLNAGFLACGFQLAFIASHLPAYLVDKGMRPTDGMAALAIIALSNVVGIYVCGLLGARHTRKYLLAGIYLLRTSAMALFVLLPLTSYSLYAFAAVMGFLWLGTVPLTNGIVSQIFGVRYIATLFGFVFFGHQLGSFLGVWLGGLVFDATRSYDLVWLCAMALGVVAALLHWPIDDRELVRDMRSLPVA